MTPNELRNESLGIANEMVRKRLPLKEAQNFANLYKRIVRVVSIDGALCDDSSTAMKPERINVSIIDGLIVEAYVG